MTRLTKKEKEEVFKTLQKVKKDLINFSELPLKETKKSKEKSLKLRKSISNGLSKLKYYKHEHVGVILTQNVVGSKK